MTKWFLRFSVFATLAVLLFIGVAPANAGHSWSNYHWSRASNPITIPFGNNVTGAWPSYLSTAASQWSVTSSPCGNVTNPVRVSLVAGGSGSRQCRVADGRVEVCNANYGFNGWLGIAGIYASGDHITKGYVKLNDSYFNTATYNTPDWRQMVMSQEIGHTFGLGHQDETFDNADLLDPCGKGSCMDYSNTPANQTAPNKHDFEQLASSYSHTDGAAFVARGNPFDDGLDVEDPGSWGRAVKFGANGRGIVYERDLPGGDRLITFVVWAE